MSKLQDDIASTLRAADIPEFYVDQISILIAMGEDEREEYDARLVDILAEWELRS